MREALNVIAEVTNSERLRQFLATGADRECQCQTFLHRLKLMLITSWRWDDGQC